MLLAAFVIGMSIYIHTACILIIFLMFVILKLKILCCSLWGDEIESDVIQIVITINNISFVNVIRRAERFMCSSMKQIIQKCAFLCEDGEAVECGKTAAKTIKAVRTKG